MKQIYSLHIEKDWLSILGESYADIASRFTKKPEIDQLKDLALLSQLGHLKTHWASLDNGDKVLMLEIQ